MSTVAAARGITESSALYSRLLGAAWLDVDPAIRGSHAAGAATGWFTLDDADGVLARVARWGLRLPPPGTACETRLVIAADANVERWTRTFGGRTVMTFQRGLPDGRLAERFGIVELRFRLHVVDGALAYEHHDAAVALGRWRVPIPRWLSPRVEARERRADHRDGSHVRVVVRAPVVGVVLAYEGVLVRTS
jgi:hypothetical protein